MKAIKQKIYFNFRTLIKEQPRVQTRFMIRKPTKEPCQRQGLWERFREIKINLLTVLRRKIVNANASTYLQNGSPAGFDVRGGMHPRTLKAILEIVIACRQNMKAFGLARTFGGASVNGYLTFLDALTFGFRESWKHVRHYACHLWVNDASTKVKINRQWKKWFRTFSLGK